VQVESYNTYSGKPVYPFGNFVSRQFVTHILAKVVAVLRDEMLSISIVVY
jgi:hypothetical protein